MVVRMDKLFTLQDLSLLSVAFCQIRLPVATQSQIPTCSPGIALFLWRYTDVSFILDSGRHSNSYHMAIFLKLNLK